MEVEVKLGSNVEMGVPVKVEWVKVVALVRVRYKRELAKLFWIKNVGWKKPAMEVLSS